VRRCRAYIPALVFSIQAYHGISHLAEKTTEEGTEGGNASSGGNHDVGGGGVLLGHEHNLQGHEYV
jgi:hypothetical protein